MEEIKNCFCCSDCGKKVSIKRLDRNNRVKCKCGRQFTFESKNDILCRCCYAPNICIQYMDKSWKRVTNYICSAL